MSQTNQNQQQLPQIDNKSHNQTSRQQLNTPQDSNNVLPLTHAKKKRKPKRKLKKHSPEHYEEIKIKKVNKKLEEKWDSHFINDEIPDFFEKRKATRKTLSKLVNERKYNNTFKNQLPPSKTVDLGLKKQLTPLPKIQKPSKRAKSFNIHVVSTKYQDTTTQKKQNSQKQPQLSQSSENKQKMSSKQEEQHQDSKNYVQEYKKKLNDLFQEKKFLYCHKEIIEGMFEKLGKKSVRDVVDKEFVLLQKGESSVNKIVQTIQNRESFLKKVEGSLLDPKKDILASFQVIDHYRTSTLAVVEEILKWKQAWQGFYLETFKKPKIFDLIYKSQNYLLTLASSTDQILQKYHQNKQNQKEIPKQVIEKKQQSNKTEKIQPKQVSEPKEVKKVTQPKQEKKVTESKQEKKVTETKQQKKLTELKQQKKPTEPKQQKKPTEPKQEKSNLQPKKEKTATEPKQQKLATETKQANKVIEQKQPSQITQQKQKKQKNQAIKQTQVHQKTQENSPKKVENKNEHIQGMEKKTDQTVQKKEPSILNSPTKQEKIHPVKQKEIQHPKDQKNTDAPKQILPGQQQQKKPSNQKVSNDPFLISVYGIHKEDNSFVLKIRACELLLIQQQYNFFKK